MQIHRGNHNARLLTLDLSFTSIITCLPRIDRSIGRENRAIMREMTKEAQLYQSQATNRTSILIKQSFSPILLFNIIRNAHPSVVDNTNRSTVQIIHDTNVRLPEALAFAQDFEDSGKNHY